ncbi:hypothetical protein GGR50DRAFT_642697 [Xylaria sp. CBS 124048]|nr:hypothetical protein GGR50DRAFT_642697 [Xylaria sp. CBS 124048]
MVSCLCSFLASSFLSLLARRLWKYLWVCYRYLGYYYVSAPKNASWVVRGSRDSVDLSIESDIYSHRRGCSGERGREHGMERLLLTEETPTMPSCGFVSTLTRGSRHSRDEWTNRRTDERPQVSASPKTPRPPLSLPLFLSLSLSPRVVRRRQASSFSSDMVRQQHYTYTSGSKLHPQDRATYSCRK